ncbi:hypothetical protein EYC84_005012 [Monilinia fructicola]|uniref:Uncharacterized protein n=1 Tax=Monilinia fructicola TaxID=38448 RepID=A0A5M9JZX6_MONFR|nr:hypothetical protein EYC84_005012 [Monilinia fructicola]
MSIMRSISLLLSFSVVSSHPSALDKRLTQSKIDQFTTTDCSDDDGKENRVSSNVNIPIDTCISIDGKTHSIYLARGTGLVWRRGMVAYSQTGCPDNVRIESFEEHDSGSACNECGLPDAWGSWN